MKTRLGVRATPSAINVGRVVHFVESGVMHLEFIRDVVSWCTPDYREVGITVVCVQGDVGGYAYFANALDQAGTAKHNIHLEDLPDYSMDVVVLPAAPVRARRPRIRLVERIVRRSGKPRFELVILANLAGYSLLGELVNLATKESTKTDEWSLDIDDPELIQRSVSLKIWEAVPDWTQMTRPPERFRPATGSPVIEDWGVPDDYEEPDPCKYHLGDRRQRSL